MTALSFTGGFALVLFWSMSEMVEKQEQANASTQHVEGALIDFYRTHREHKGIVGMATYMKEHLSPEDYELWLQQRDYSYYR